MAESKYRARISLGHYATERERDSAIATAQRLLGSATSPQEARTGTIADDVLDIPANARLVTTKPLALSLDTWLYCSDLHIPFHNRDWLKRLILVAGKHDVSTLVIGGDLYDFASVSRHPKTEQQASLNETIRIAGDVLVALGRYFERLYILPGNHDNRVASKLDQPLEFASLIHASIRGRIPAERITTTDYDYIRIDDWVVGHPRFYSSTPARGVARVAQLQQCNVIGAHNHIVGMMQSADGRYWAIDPGHMTDPALTPYMMQSAGLSKYAAWKNGFVLVDNNLPTLFTDGLTDWSKYGS